MRLPYELLNYWLLASSIVPPSAAFVPPVAIMPWLTATTGETEGMLVGYLQMENSLWITTAGNYYVWRGAVRLHRQSVNTRVWMTMTLRSIVIWGKACFDQSISQSINQINFFKHCLLKKVKHLLAYLGQCYKYTLQSSLWQSWRDNMTITWALHLFYCNVILNGNLRTFDIPLMFLFSVCWYTTPSWTDLWVYFVVTVHMF